MTPEPSEVRITPVALPAGYIEAGERLMHHLHEQTFKKSRVSAEQLEVLMKLKWRLGKWRPWGSRKESEAIEAALAEIGRLRSEYAALLARQKVVKP